MQHIPTLLHTDVYKIGHEAQYPEGTSEIYSTLVARSAKWANASVVFGWEYYLKEFLVGGIKPGDAKLFMHYANAILGPDKVSPAAFYALEKLGYWPVEIKSLPEGSLVGSGNVQATFTSTDTRFPWAGGLLEGLLLKVWHPMTVATNSLRLRKVAELFADKTVGNHDHVPYQIHDFGYRGCSSDETAALGGAAHLLSFRGSDTVIGGILLDQYYNADNSTAAGDIASSVPASEHSVITSFGRENELAAFHNMLDRYPKGIVSIVSDSYNLWEVLTTFADELYERIMTREGTTVFRPDSGCPELILLGDPDAPEGSPAHQGALELLWAKFGGTVNALGYRVLDSHVSVIYGDGIYFERLLRIWVGMERKGFATVPPFGIGGLLLQQFSRDQLGFAFKATHVIVNQESREIYKDPITDSGKRSFKGYVLVERDPQTGLYTTKDQVSQQEAEGGELRIIFRDGKIYYTQNLQQIRERLATETIPEGFIPTLEELYALADRTPVKGHFDQGAANAEDVKLAAFMRELLGLGNEEVRSFMLEQVGHTLLNQATEPAPEEPVVTLSVVVEPPLPKTPPKPVVKQTAKAIK